MTAEDKAFLFRTLRDPVIREAVERLAPINPDAQTALRVACAFDRAHLARSWPAGGLHGA
jgi:hypothetical protein